MSTARSKFRLLKLFINLVLLICLGIILFQNNQSVPLELLAWQVEVSLSFLIIGVALLGALITFITVLIIGRR